MKKYKGIALDIGTTNIVAALISGGDSIEGEISPTYRVTNCQNIYAPDLIGRISAAEKDYKALREALVFSVNCAVSEICAVAGVFADELYTVAVGNSLMSCFFAGLPVDGLGKSPYTAPSRLGKEYEIAGYIGGKAYIAPIIGSFVGGDVSAGIYRFARDRDGVLFIDAGTNGEVYGCYGGRRLACSAAAGPALEVGVGDVPFHQRGIDAVRTEGAIVSHTVGGELPQGLAGSGVIELISLLLGKECDERGKIEGGKVTLQGGFEFTEEHVCRFQLAKAALAAATLSVMKGLKMPPNALKKLYVAGAIGSAVSEDALIRTGIIPAFAKGKTRFVGNSALQGAVLLTEEKARWEITELAAATSVLPLEKSEYFKERFAEELFFYE